jgi:hypothetical protein
MLACPPRSAWDADTALRRAATAAMIERHRHEVGCGPLSPRRVQLAGSSSVQVVGSADSSLVLLACPRMTRFTADELAPAVQQVFTLSLARAELPDAEVRLLVAGAAAAESLRGWMRRLAGPNAVPVDVADPGEPWRSRLMSREQAWSVGA